MKALVLCGGMPQIYLMQLLKERGITSLDEEVRENPVIYPDDELLANCQAYVNLDTETNMYMDTLWTDLMSAAPEYSEWAMPLFLAGCLIACVAITVGKKQYRRRKEQFSYDTYRKNIMP